MDLSKILKRIQKALPADFDPRYRKSWLLKAPIEEIEREREKLRKPAYFSGDRKARQLTDRMDEALIYRRNKEYSKQHPDVKTGHHEHGWYLPGDD